jgi:putative aldouronate transport system permease protein
MEQLGKRLKKSKNLYILLLPSFIWVIIFAYFPIYGVYMAFVNYQPGVGNGGFLMQLFTSKFVGFSWFHYFFTSSDFYILMRNTLCQSLLSFALSFPAPIILAIALNEVKIGPLKKAVQTASYLPYFISWVIAANIIVTLLSSDGAVNNILIALGLVSEPVIFMQKPNLFWLIIALSNVWKDSGYNSVIYLAAISGINPELYESCTIDGANKLDRIRYIILPALKPTIVVLLILSSSNIINAGFDQQFLLMNQTVMSVADVIDTYNYRYGLVRGMFSYATAIGLFKSVISFILLVTVNKLSKKLSDQGLF